MIYNVEGNRLNEAYSVDGLLLNDAYDIDGQLVYSKEPPHTNYDEYTVSSLFTYSGSSFQSFSVYDGKIAQVRENDGLHIIDINTHQMLKKVTMNMGHGNSCQFSDEFYEPDDDFPLFYIRNDGVWLYRIVGTSSTLIKKYAFSSSIIGTYVAGFGVDSTNKRFYTASYTEGDYVTKTGQMRICEWDMNDVTDNGNGTYSFALLRSNDFSWFDKYQAVQGSCYHDGYFFIANGQGKQSVVLVDINTLTIAHEVALDGSEIEGCAWVGDEYMIVGQSPTNIQYRKVEFAKS